MEGSLSILPISPDSLTDIAATGRTFHRCFLLNFCSFGYSVSEKKNFNKSTNQKQELPVVAMFVNGLIVWPNEP
jgi:hypothetical protein